MNVDHSGAHSGAAGCPQSTASSCELAHFFSSPAQGSGAFWHQQALKVNLPGPGFSAQTVVGMGNMNVSSGHDTPESTMLSQRCSALLASPYTYIQSSELRSHGKADEPVAREENTGRESVDRRRQLLSAHQKHELLKVFRRNGYLTKKQKSDLATHLGMTEKQVGVWFQNQRQKEKSVEKMVKQDLTTGIDNGNGPTFSLPADFTPPTIPKSVVSTLLLLNQNRIKTVVFTMPPLRVLLVPDSQKKPRSQTG
ncbi:homeobox domain-containing protein [Endozoicomonas sp. SCSIO W0465]|uniref:homeobox domain-containing protein n=1 Tax=Endozoicomonas sp. SCSIO W0465 TaxID=2918516 RepID=UPI0020752268|nr:homeobox domain-containing protein [Endozoicomonas sp. SCSIO W0465]USE38756.1 homeobox domain-containing protein [Endozoicomonas sp. SCSIO W0465]